MFEQPEEFEGPYRIFSTAFDQEIEYTSSKDLRAKIQIVAALYSPPDFDTYLNACVDQYEQAGHDLVSQLSAAASSDLEVTLLLDHSGSLRGEPSCLLAALAGIYSECLSRLGLKHEVLAFTTSSWRGGQSHLLWRKQGHKPAPGRLCDLLHIVYHTTDAPGPISHEALVQMTDPWLLKENVDGEALLWARGRIEKRNARRRIIIVISDGAPVDDSTLLINGPNILDDHLREVAKETVGAGRVELYGIGLHYAMHRYYPQYAVIDDCTDIARIALPTLGAILSTSTHAPTVEQFDIQDD